MRRAVTQERSSRSGYLARAVAELEPPDLASRYANRQAPTGLLFGLRAFGWRAIVQEYGDIEGYERNVNGTRVVVSMNPWLRQGESKIRQINVRAHVAPDHAPPSPVQMSELVFQLDGIVV
jgi:hypothetical protein